MGNVIGRLFYPFSSHHWTKQSSAQYRNNEPPRTGSLEFVNANIASVTLDLREDFADHGSGVDGLVITCLDYWRIQALLRDITEKQFERAYQQAVLLKSSGIKLRPNL